MHNKNIRLAWLAAILGCCAHYSFAAHQQIGSTGWPLLNLIPDARSTAMGRAYCAVNGDSNSIFYNPAGLGSLTHSELTFVKNYWFEDVEHYYAGFACNLHDIRASNVYELGTIMVGFMSADASGLAAPLSNPKDHIIVIGYGKPVFEGEGAGTIMAGVGAKFYKEEFGGTTLEGQAFDGGVLWRSAAEDLSVGLSGQNIGDKMAHAGQSPDLPMNIKAGAAGKIGEMLILGADVNAPQNGNAGVNVGAEYWLLHSMALRAGYNSTPGKETGFSGGIGLSLKRLDAGMCYAHEIGIDYSYVPYGSAGAVHRLGMVLKLGAE